jgi:hypothetical protein
LVYGLNDTQGWWNTIETEDLNKDGLADFVLANHGKNTFFKSGDRMYVSDFDGNGSIEQIFCTKSNGKYFPIVDKDEFLSQLPSYRKRLLYYKDYGKKSIDEFFPKAVLDEARIFEVSWLASVMLLSGKEGYTWVELPEEAQFSPIYGLLLYDVDQDGVCDMLAGGNQYQVKPQFGRYDASNGWFFKGTLNEGNFSFAKGEDINVKGQIRDIEYIEIKGRRFVLFAKYDDDLEIHELGN